jgi:hypothetical protein
MAGKFVGGRAVLSLDRLEAEINGAGDFILAGYGMGIDRAIATQATGQAETAGKRRDVVAATHELELSCGIATCHFTEGR